ncbi:HNH endonuclease [Rubidibacter lacunae KORDI 51-2]|uniref:HNH endonuclease n=2 Tax=Rubidibacter TaxID=582491 RepID=U5DE52_9CHRO|nr:HNH endonuclease [Rubidibacter lacunae KORDI 51-2]
MRGDRAQLNLHPLPSTRAMQACQLCDREVARLTVHHLVPRQAVKRKKADPGPTVKICAACHKQIHALFDNATLARQLNTPEALSAEPQMQKFLAWIRKQDPNKRVRVS